MNEQRIKEIASQCSDFADQIPYFRGIENGLTWEATIQKARDLKFAELIVRECANVAAEHDALDIYEEIREHFGVER